MDEIDDTIENFTNAKRSAQQNDNKLRFLNLFNNMEAKYIIFYIIKPPNLCFSYKIHLKLKISRDSPSHEFCLLRKMVL